MQLHLNKSLICSPSNRETITLLDPSDFLRQFATKQVGFNSMSKSFKKRSSLKIKSNLTCPKVFTELIQAPACRITFHKHLLVSRNHGPVTPLLLFQKRHLSHSLPSRASYHLQLLQALVTGAEIFQIRCMYHGRIKLHTGQYSLFQAQEKEKSSKFKTILLWKAPTFPFLCLDCIIP